MNLTTLRPWVERLRGEILARVAEPQLPFVASVLDLGFQKVAVDPVLGLFGSPIDEILSAPEGRDERVGISLDLERPWEDLPLQLAMNDVLRPLQDTTAPLDGWKTQPWSATSHGSPPPREAVEAHPVESAAVQAMRLFFMAVSEPSWQSLERWVYIGVSSPRPLLVNDPTNTFSGRYVPWSIRYRADVCGVGVVEYGTKDPGITLESWSLFGLQQPAHRAFARLPTATISRRSDLVGLVPPTLTTTHIARVGVRIDHWPT